ncbi:uncharacterized protein LOC112688152 isoform X2 [Sipha flava]|uniref:Uncharacterized protein LOC112688152 isoform X2 n=1 Tax=Sipha flava TaxID=143950 RepID=A0A8B8G326_9HEMI|nr:uncharacterized protein LOC112688152 isoform X2 [Sipha flava]
MERLKEQVNRKVEIVENIFISINDEIGCQIQNASQKLDEFLITIDNSLSSILENLNSGDFMQFDFLRKSFGDVEDLINKRNQKINDFTNVTRELEKKRTALIETCYKQYMSELSGESFEWLFEKYLKNYNIIKLGNFRTYEDLRFKLVLLSENLRQDFLLRAYEVKLNIKANITKIFRDKFRTAAETIISDNIFVFQTKSIDIVNESNKLIDNLTYQVKKQLNFATIIEGSESLKTYSRNIDNTVDSVLLPLVDKAPEDIQSLSMKTLEELDRIMKDSGESLSPDEITAIGEEMLNEADGLLQDITETIMDVRLLLSDVKVAIQVIYELLRVSIDIIDGHSKRLTEARNIVLVALETNLRFNDTELNIFVDSFNVAFDSLVQASTETEVLMFEKKCNDELINIENRIQINRESEMYTISGYNDLVTSEFATISADIQDLLNSLPKIIKSVPEFNYLSESKFWKKSIETSIIPFKAAVDSCQKTFNERLLKLIEELITSDLLSNECAWTTFLTNGVEERYADAAKWLEQRTVIMNDGIAKRRTDEIEDHQNILERHIKVTQEMSEHLQRKTNELLEGFDRQRDLISKNVELVQSNIEQLPMLELSEKTNALRALVDSVANELNDQYKSHYNTVEWEYEAIRSSTSELIKSIKLFPEGGNHGHEEAKVIVDALNDLTRTMSEQQTETMNLLKRIDYGSLSKTKESLSKLINSVEIELDKKILIRKYYAINRIMKVTVNQEILNLEKMIDSLHTDLRHVEETFGKDDIAELSKRWSQLLAETQAFVDYFFESYRDIRVLLKSHTRDTIWNSKAENIKITNDSANTFLRGQSKFYDYCKTDFGSSTGTDVGARFLNNIHLAMRQYVSESQNNAADMALIESNNVWLTEQSDIAQVYREIMVETLGKIRATVSQAESIWISKLSEFCDFLRDGLHVAERKFKNDVLSTYHQEWLTGLTQECSSFDDESQSTRQRLKAIRDRLRDKLKPSHGHPDNAAKLEALLYEFRSVRSECEDTLQDVCARAKIRVEKLAKNYESGRPEDVMKATTMSVKCHSGLRIQLDNVNTNLPVLSVGNEYEAIPKSLVDRITEERAVEKAVKNVKRYTSETGAGIVFWSDNQRLWADNLHVSDVLLDFSTALHMSHFP